MKSVKAPQSWSQVAVEIAASKYFRKIGRKQERSIGQLVSRIVNTIVEAGVAQKILSKGLVAESFRQELSFILLTQRAFFNSPVWFNCGVFKKPQVSACFIQSISDDLDGIFDLLKNEARIFKFGSGSGTNFSVLRSKYEQLAQGGTSSGLMSFLRVFDSGAGSIKSGGTTRRAAKMVCVDIDHPEIEEFIQWKANEEKKAHALIRQGYAADYEGEAYRTVSGQNSNNSIRVTDAFMKAVAADQSWALKSRTTGRTIKEVSAKKLWDELTKAAWQCADPGLQFDDTINRWHSCSPVGRIFASNPCSEYMFLDDSACNLASLNLAAFIDEDGHYDMAAYLQTIKIIFTAQEILVDLAGYPTEKIDKNSRQFRPLGIGFCGLGALLMRKGIPYDSDLGRLWAAGLTAALQGKAMLTSAELAQAQGAFLGYKKVKASYQKVMRKHLSNFKAQDFSQLGSGISLILNEIWHQAFQLGARVGFRNAQFSLMAPTGTIGLVMDCDTTGIEPEYSLIRYKKLSGGGNLLLTSQSVTPGLRRLGYSEKEIQEIQNYLQKHLQIEGAPHLKVEHFAVFDCAQKNGKTGRRQISVAAHLKMMAVIQPYLSGAISKTVNLPRESTIHQVSEVYRQAWQLGLKSIAIYRDGCKLSQPLSQESDYPKCAECGSPTELVGGCYRCTNCGFTTGCIS